MRFVRSTSDRTRFRSRDDNILQNALKICALAELLMRHEVPLAIIHGLTRQRLESPASKSHHFTPKEMRINRKSQAC